MASFIVAMNVNEVPDSGRRSMASRTRSRA